MQNLLQSPIAQQMVGQIGQQMQQQMPQQMQNPVAQQMSGQIGQYAQQQMPQMNQLAQMMPKLSNMGASSTSSVMSQFGRNPAMSKQMSMGCPPCERGSRVLIYISILTLAILILVFASTESFGLNLLWMSMLLVGFVIFTFIFL